MKQGPARIGALASIALGILLLSGPVIAQGAYGSNVQSSVSTNVTVSSGGTASVDNSATQGLIVQISGATPGSSLVVTTQTLNAPNSGVGAPPTYGTTFLFDVSISLPAGTTLPAGATVTVSFSNPSIVSGDQVFYWTGSSWQTASGVTVTGTTISGQVPASAVGGTNFAVGMLAPTTQASNNYLLYGIVAVIVIIGIAVALFTRRKGTSA
jgi:hypothetical protein